MVKDKGEIKNDLTIYLIILILKFLFTTFFNDSFVELFCYTTFIERAVVSVKLLN